MPSVPSQQIVTTVPLSPATSLDAWVVFIAIGTVLIAVSAACQALLCTPAQSTPRTFPRSLRVRDVTLLPLSVFGAAAFISGVFGASTALQEWTETASTGAAQEAVGGAEVATVVEDAQEGPFTRVVTLSVDPQHWRCRVVTPEQIRILVALGVDRSPAHVDCTPGP